MYTAVYAYIMEGWFIKSPYRPKYDIINLFLWLICTFAQYRTTYSITDILKSSQATKSETLANILDTRLEGSSPCETPTCPNMIERQQYHNVRNRDGKLSFAFCWPAQYGTVWHQPCATTVSRCKQTGNASLWATTDIIRRRCSHFCDLCAVTSVKIYLVTYSLTYFIRQHVSSSQN